MTVRAIKEWPDGHPFKNGIIGFVKRRIVSSENQSPKLAPEGPETEAESIRAEALRRLKVDRFVARTPAPTSSLSESQSNTQQTMESTSSDKQNTKKFEEIVERLLPDEIVVNALNREYGDAAQKVIKELKEGGSPEINGVYALDFLADLLMNEARTFKTYWALGDFGEYPIQIYGLGSVFYHKAPEFDLAGYFESEEDAADDIKSNWSDNLLEPSVEVAEQYAKRAGRRY